MVDLMGGANLYTTIGISSSLTSGGILLATPSERKILGRLIKSKALLVNIKLSLN